MYLFDYTQLGLYFIYKNQPTQTNIVASLRTIACCFFILKMGYSHHIELAVISTLVDQPSKINSQDDLHYIAIHTFVHKVVGKQ